MGVVVGSVVEDGSDCPNASGDASTQANANASLRRRCLRICLRVLGFAFMGLAPWEPATGRPSLRQNAFWIDQ